MYLSIARNLPKVSFLGDASQESLKFGVRCCLSDEALLGTVGFFQHKTSGPPSRNHTTTVHNGDSLYGMS